MEDLERKKQEWNKLYDSLYHGKEVTQFPVPRRGCMAREDAAELWADPDESKIQDPDDVISINFGEGKGTKKVWNKPFSVRDSKSGKSYCARETDPAVQKAPQYHDLQELISIKADNDPSWPRGRRYPSLSPRYTMNPPCVRSSATPVAPAAATKRTLPAPLVMSACHSMFAIGRIIRREVSVSHKMHKLKKRVPTKGHLSRIDSPNGINALLNGRETWQKSCGQIPTPPSQFSASPWQMLAFNLSIHMPFL